MEQLFETIPMILPNGNVKEFEIKHALDILKIQKIHKIKKDDLIKLDDSYEVLEGEDAEKRAEKKGLKPCNCNHRILIDEVVKSQTITKKSTRKKKVEPEKVEEDIKGDV